ncbi:hypothetical protein GCM10011515_12820 [Tsuneonella deserti]|uniref:Acid-resistance membrane protein n=1 Tax=Tsuneonella deserti TaxID=2035528 RepID=A0ABQ1S7C8_9SPHN|nr:hypothetical protein [Tsuneonella deserti]GGD94427.1 hypothetical protein GCM10011515_12820 [Tsuneonella deserti]
MNQNVMMSERSTRVLRIAGWSLAIMLLIAPAIAMQFPNTGVDWTASDFVFAALVFALVGGLLELAARASRNISYRAAVLMAVACAFLQLWITLAVGIIGSENNPANWTYIAMVVFALSVSTVTRGKAQALSRGMVVMAVVQLSFSAMHLLDGHFTAVIDLFFAWLWLGSSRLFARAARQTLES